MRALPLLLLIGVAACAQQQTVEFLPSRKGAEELRAMQTRVVAGEPDEVARAVIGTLHDLGYRITRADAETGTISATRATALRIAVVVRPRPPGQVAVRANATIVALRQEAQVDAAEFYSANFFNQLSAFMQRDLVTLASREEAPEAVRPVAERLALRERAAAAESPAQPSQGTPAQ
ncbi:hypothetical protein [Siccirubricoccus deserti]|uniref:Uncharacterized protein n=1 Tax=Siccirubricoccus deserti TaxID=2013562 RepID=A0A9X0QXA9_9PROT|nr:hypothetical protein [Siccirubricoccus deserti]MBC4015674.1 hypothetical protein [Siccirubricoccus deserti]